MKLEIIFTWAAQVDMQRAFEMIELGRSRSAAC